MTDDYSVFVDAGFFFGFCRDVKVSLRGGVFPKLLLLFVSILLFVCSSEILTRAYHYARYNRAFFDDRDAGKSVVRDERLGWRAREYFHFRYLRRDEKGKAYLASGSTGKWGFRALGDIHDTGRRYRILIVGDSFTHALEVGDNETYYAFLRKALPVEIFAYGAIGYGNLQEFMILDEFIDMIKPDLLLMQLCTNDFINNSYELESLSIINNQRMRRPYLNEKGELFYKTPGCVPSLRTWLVSHSRFFSFLFHRWDLALAQFKGCKSVEVEIQNSKGVHQKYEAAKVVTAKVFKKIKERSGKVPVFVFVADRLEPFYGDFRKISKDTGLVFLDGVAAAVWEAHGKGEAVFVQDEGHWSPRGHEVAGLALLTSLKDYLPSFSSQRADDVSHFKKAKRE